MTYELSQRFIFEAAHTLQRSIDKETSNRVHGHTYHAEVFITGKPNEATGMIMDLAVFRQQIDKVRDTLDHRLLDDVPGLGAPTIENLCRYIATHLKPRAPTLSAVRVWREGSGDGCKLAIS